MRKTFKTKQTKEQHRLGSIKGGEILKSKFTSQYKEKYYKNPNICLYCHNIISYEKRVNKFCSHSCAASYNNKSKFHKNPYYENFCKNCGKKLTSLTAFYCSHKCQKQFQHKMFIDKWQKGEISGRLQGEYLSTNIRHYLFEKYNNKCVKCGWGEMNPYSKKIPLEVEHIDGNFLNNKEENLTLLCPNCHSLTSTAKGMNKGKGRYSRKVWYYKTQEELRTRKGI